MFLMYITVSSGDSEPNVGPSSAMLNKLDHLHNLLLTKFNELYVFAPNMQLSIWNPSKKKNTTVNCSLLEYTVMYTAVIIEVCTAVYYNTLQCFFYLSTTPARVGNNQFESRSGKFLRCKQKFTRLIATIQIQPEMNLVKLISIASSNAYTKTKSKYCYNRPVFGSKKNPLVGTDVKC